MGLVSVALCNTISLWGTGCIILVKSFIHSFIQEYYVSPYYMPDMALGTGKESSKFHKNRWEKIQNHQIKTKLQVNK